MTMHRFLSCCILIIVIQRTDASRLMMENKLRIEREFVKEETARGVFEGLRDGTVPYPQDSVNKKLIKVNGDAGTTMKFSNNWDKVQAFRDIIYEEAHGKVSGILRLQEMKQAHYEYARMLVNNAINNTVMEDGGTIHLYLSRPESSALANHTDTTDIFVLQLVGAKEWILCDNEASRLLDTKLRGKLDKCATYTATEMNSLFCEKTTLYPGDALYLPKQVVHSARATSEGLSAHLTFGFADNTCSVNDIDACVAPQLEDHIRQRRLLCNSDQGGLLCNTNCNDSCDESCAGFDGGCNTGCDHSCDQGCAICPTPPPTAPPTPPPTTSPPTRGPTPRPTPSPTPTPTPGPTSPPTPLPTPPPTPGPTSPPTPGPTPFPTPPPSPGPTNPPTPLPTNSPSNQPSYSPTTSEPSHSPTRSDSSLPTAPPTTKPSPRPSTAPTPKPSVNPSLSPTEESTKSQTLTQPPSQSRSNIPSLEPSTSPIVIEVIVAPEAAGLSNTMIYVIAGAAAAVLLPCLYFFYRGRNRGKVEKVSVQVEKRGDGYIQVTRTTKFIGSSRLKVEKLEFPNESTANAEGYFLNTTLQAGVNNLNHQSAMGRRGSPPTDSPTQSTSESVPTGDAFLLEMATSVHSSKGRIIPNSSVGARTQQSGENIKHQQDRASQRRADERESKDAARLSRPSDTKNHIRSSSNSSTPGAYLSREGNVISEDVKHRRDIASLRRAEERGSNNASQPSRLSDAKNQPRAGNNMPTVPGAFTLKDGFENRVSRKSGNSSNNQVSNSINRNRRRSSDEKVKARLDGSDPSTPGAHSSDEQTTPRSRKKDDSRSGRRSPSSRSSRSGGRSRNVVPRRQVDGLPSPPNISEALFDA